MPAPLVGRKFGVNVISPPDMEDCRGLKVLGISGSSRQAPNLSKSERILQQSLDLYESFGCTTRLIRLKDLKIYHCEGNYSEDPSQCIYPCMSTLKYPDDQMQQVYDAILECDILILASPIRWNNHSALIQKCIERLNCIENQYSWFGNRMIQKKVAGLIIIGHVDGIQHVAGNLFNFFSWLGFSIPDVAITSWVGEHDEDTTRDWEKIEANPYTQEDLVNMVHSSLHLACSLKEE